MDKPTIIEIPLSNGPGALKPTRIVLHSMGEYIDCPDRDYTAWGFLEKMGWSAHRFGCPTGTIVKGRADILGAWHCKADNGNYDSLGYEFLVPGLHTYGSFLEAIKRNYLTEAAWWAGVWQVREWVKAWQIPIERIEPHSKLAPGQKFDPGPGFDLPKFINDVKTG